MRRWLLRYLESQLPTRAAMARAAISLCCEDFTMRERHHAQMKMKSWMVASVIMWVLYGHGFEASKDWISVSHFIHLFNTTMSMPCTHSRLIPMYNARFILWPPSLSSPIRKKLVNGQMPEMGFQPLKQSLCLATQSQLGQSLATNHEIRNKKFQNFTSILR